MAAKVEITKELVSVAQRGTRWDVGNKVLYDLCRLYPRHDEVDQIVAKVWLIGRAYAAAIERRKEKTEFQGDAFYTEHVAPKLKEWQIDRWLSPLSSMREVTPENLDAILSCHRQLTDAFYRLTTLDKRSLASKYLHFHHPHLFFIYDTRAHAALRLLSTGRVRKQQAIDVADDTYRNFCLKVLALRDRIEKTYGPRLSPRDLDNLLLEVSRIDATRVKGMTVTA
jgi:hypothetical protein